VDLVQPLLARVTTNGTKEVSFFGSFVPDGRGSQFFVRVVTIRQSKKNLNSADFGCAVKAGAFLVG